MNQQNVSAHHNMDIRSWTEALAVEAGELLLEYFQSPDLQVAEKTGPKDLVTEADRVAEELIIRRIGEQFPDDAILAEESGKSASCDRSEMIWVIDPLDGTNNFARGDERFGVMICRAQNPFCRRENAETASEEGKTVDIAVVYLPITKTLISAEKEKGTTVNGQLTVIADAVQRSYRISLGHFPEHASAEWSERVQRFVEDAQGTVLNLHSAAACIAALVQREIVAHVNDDFYAWDFAPQQLIAQEAGLIVKRITGEEIDWWNPQGGQVFALPSVYQEFQNLVQ